MYRTWIRKVEITCASAHACKEVKVDFGTNPDFLGIIKVPG